MIPALASGVFSKRDGLTRFLTPVFTGTPTPSVTVWKSIDSRHLAAALLRRRPGSGDGVGITHLADHRRATAVRPAQRSGAGAEEAGPWPWRRPVSGPPERAAWPRLKETLTRQGSTLSAADRPCPRHDRTLLATREPMHKNTARRTSLRGRNRDPPSDQTTRKARDNRARSRRSVLIVSSGSCQ